MGSKKTFDLLALVKNKVEAREEKNGVSAIRQQPALKTDHSQLLLMALNLAP